MNTKFYCALILIGFLLSGCSNYQYNPGFFNKDGPMYVKKVAPEPAMSVAEQNSQAIAAFSDKGFEAVESDKGVIIYLPPNIYFSSNTAEINLDARAKIAEISTEINKDYLVDREIEVSGHTDSVGSPEANMATSKSRAEAATAELVFSNVAVTRIQTTWFGEDQPRVAELDSDGQLIAGNRALNRRVEFTILNPVN